MRRTVIAMALAGILLAGCTNESDGERGTPEPEATATDANPPEDEPEENETEDDEQPEDDDGLAEPDVVVTREHLGLEIEIGVYAIEVQDDVAALVVDYEATGGWDGIRQQTFSRMLDGGASGERSGAGLRLISGEERLTYPVALGGDGSPASAFIAERDEDRWRSLSLHAAPATDTVDLLIPGLGAVLDVPVTDAGEAHEIVTAEVDQPEGPSGYELRTYSASYDDASSVEEEGDEITVTLTSDLLFGPDESELGGDADAALEDVAEEIAASSEGGEVRVIGHTDDVPTDAFESNQELSELRAESVGDRLTDLLDGEYDIATEGRGEDEPRASNSSDDGRAANRRVEIRFEGRRVTVSEDESSGEAQLPEAEGAEASGDDAAEVDGWAIAAESVIRQDGMLIGTLRVTYANDEEPGGRLNRSLNPASGENDNVAWRRGFRGVTRDAGATYVSLLTSEERVFPFAHAVGAGEAEEEDEDEEGSGPIRLLGDERTQSHTPEASDEGRIVTVIWPDTGQSNVTIDVAGQFRLSDVPVSESAEG